MFKYYGKYAPYLFLLPAAIVLVIFFFIPFFQTFLLSFMDYSHNIYEPAFIGLENYINLFRNPIFYKVLWNTFVYLFVAVPILAIFPLFLAILINQKIKGVTLNTYLSACNCFDSSCGYCVQMALRRSGNFKLSCH